MSSECLSLFFGSAESKSSEPEAEQRQAGRFGDAYHHVLTQTAANVHKDGGRYLIGVVRIANGIDNFGIARCAVEEFAMERVLPAR